MSHRSRLVVLVVCTLLPHLSVAKEPTVDHVLVDKSERTMYLFSAGEKVRAYRVALGGNPVGHKLRRGDKRTPEGLYYLDYKKGDSAYYKAIHISYPNASDRESARRAGVDPGGQIMIHGQKNGFGWLAARAPRSDWTDGCIAVADHEMDEIWRLVPVGTPIEIRP